MFEEKIQIRCLQRDVHLFKELIPECVTSYEEFMRTQVGLDYPLELEVAKNMKLE
jgi:hypothetical protein